MNSRTKAFQTTVFSEFSALAAEVGAVNLGQGFPDFDGPDLIKEAAAKAIRDGVNQYAQGSGAPVLRTAISEHALRFYGQKVDPNTMVTVTSGATEAIFDAVMGLVEPGDEVVLFEPFYDSYEASVVMAGAAARHVLLRPPDDDHASWWFDEEELRAAFSAKTKLCIVNTPHNPTGKVFTREELEFIGDLCARHDATLLSDEVYEHLTFAPAHHLRPATLPGLAERTVTVSSAGKSFSLTGWKVGWVIAPPTLREAVQRVHQYVTFATAAPLQVAVAAALRLPDSYFATFQADYRLKRDALAAGLALVGLSPHVPDGAYFIMADISGSGFADDFAFCRHLTREVGVAAIPPSAFYADHHKAQGQEFARFAFCKTAATLQSAITKLTRYKPAHGP